MKRITAGVALLCLFNISILAEPAISCLVSPRGEDALVTVRVSTPHPGEMTMTLPDGRIIWLQAGHIPFQYPAKADFENLAEFIIDSKARGSWFNDWGEPEIVSVLSGDGQYILSIGNDLDSRDGGGPVFACKFSLPADDA